MRRVPLKVAAHRMMVEAVFAFVAVIHHGIQTTITPTSTQTLMPAIQVSIRGTQQQAV